MIANQRGPLTRSPSIGTDSNATKMGADIVSEVTVASGSSLTASTSRPVPATNSAPRHSCRSNCSPAGRASR